VLRGEIWTYRPVLERPGQSLLRIILSADGFNRDESRVQVMGAHIVDHDPGGLLSVRVAPHGWVVLPTLGGDASRPTALRRVITAARQGAHTLITLHGEENAVIAPYEWARQALPELIPTDHQEDADP
jgi:hypothetical protein